MEKALLIFIKLKYPAELSKIGNFYNQSYKKNYKSDYFNEEVEELKNLVISAGAEVSDVIIHNQDEINPRFYISRGKLEEIKSYVSCNKYELIVFDNDLTPAQQSNLENKLNIKVIDRTALILDIFAQRARSSEGKYQVELAQLNYLLPRLRGKGVQLSRLGGGIGTRGPGEQKLEIDRRKIRKRIAQLENKIDKIAVQRETQRKQRQQKNLFQASLVGYTNSGKSTLLNTITKSQFLVKDMLFSTLDSTTRKIKIPEIDEILISDTVGFIDKLPHQLVAAFKSTLEELKKANLLILTVDISSVNYEKHIKSVSSVLKEIKVEHKPTIIVFNKIDKLKEKELYKFQLKFRDAVFISALKNIGLEQLYEKIKYFVDRNRIEVSLKIPYENKEMISYIFNNCKIVKKQYLEDSMFLIINANNEILPKIKSYIYRTKQKTK